MGPLRSIAAPSSVAPDDPLVRKRTAGLKLQVTERHMSAARAAHDAGDDETAIGEYRIALDAAPELGSMRLALAELLVARDDTAGAVTVLRDDASGDRDVSLLLGQVLLGRGEYEEAREVYAGLLARDPADEEARTGERVAQETLDFQAQPEEYRRIAAATRATRADLAALLTVKVTALSGLPPARAAGGGGHLRVLGPRACRYDRRSRDHGRLPQPHLPAAGHAPAGGPGPGREPGAAEAGVAGGAGPGPRRTWARPTSTARR